MAGRIQLTTKGVQDIYFTEEPDYSHFVQLFKRHTNYTTQFVKLDIDGKAEFGKVVRMTIPKDQGDMIKTISLDVELNPFEDAETTRIGYVESIGHAMIEYVDMYIGDEKIQHIPSDYLQIYSEYNYTQTKQKALEKLIGKYPERTSDVPVASGVILGHLGPATTTRKVFVDIPFYFYQHPELAVPLCSMCYQEVTIEIKFRDIENCVVKTDPPVDTSVRTTTLDYEVETSTVLTSNIIAVSNDGLSFASNVNNSIELSGKTTFVGDGIVSPAMNIIVNSSGIYRYENAQWVQRSTDAISGDVYFTDDGNALAQVGVGLWVWNGSGYDFTSNTELVALSRDGSAYATRIVGNINDTFKVFEVSTNTQIGDNQFSPTSTGPVKVLLSYDASHLLIAISDQLFIYELFQNEWIGHGQVIEIFEIDEIVFNTDGDAIFIYNATETYQIGNTSSSGVGRLYTYDQIISRWVEVYRYKGVGGTYATVNDTYDIITVRRSATETDYIKLQPITRSVENYDDIVVRSVENITQTGSAVYGVGYQALGTETRQSYLINENTTYSVNIRQTATSLTHLDVRISNDGLFFIAFDGSFIRLYYRNRLNNIFRFQENASIDLGANTFIKFYISKNTEHFAVVVREPGNNYITTVYRRDATVVITDTNTTSVETRILFSNDETTVTMYNEAVYTYSLVNPNDPPTVIVEPDFNFPILSVAHDLNRFVKYDSSSGTIKLFNSDTSQSGLKINLQGVAAAAFSKDGNQVAFMTNSYTYIYSFDGNGWNLKSSLYASIDLQLFYDFKMTDDGNGLSYVDGISTGNKDRTIIRLYTYTGVEWKRVFRETDLDGDGIVADMSDNMLYYTYASPSGRAQQVRLLTVKSMNRQSETVVVNVDQEFSSLYPDQIKTCKLCLEMVYLDDYERSFIKKHKKDYVITQLQRGTYTLPKGIESHKIRTNFINPVKELFFVIRRVNNKQYDDFTSPFDYDNDALTSEDKLIFYENLKSLELTLNDTQVLDQDTGNFVFLKAIQPAIHHSKTPLIRRFYMYSFACEPEQFYPTGQVNFSLINNQLITVNLTENTTKDRTIDVYALSYNVLRLDKGMMRMLFNT